MTAKQFLKLNPEKYLMVSYEFGDPVFVAPVTGLSIKDIQVTVEKEKAEIWSAIDNTPTKLNYYTAATGLKGLVFKHL